MEHPANTLISEGFACLENVRLLNIIAKILSVAFRKLQRVQYLSGPQYSIYNFSSQLDVMGFYFPPTCWINAEFAKGTEVAALM